MTWHRRIEELAQEYGCSVSVTHGGHLKIRHPMGWFIFTANTPSDWRAFRNTASLLRRKSR